MEILEKDHPVLEKFPRAKDDISGGQTNNWSSQKFNFRVEDR